MKIYHYAIIAATALLVTSCSKETTEQIPSTPEPVKSEVEFTDNMLAFGSMQEAEIAIDQLLRMSSKERRNWYESKDPQFISQEEIFQIAIDEQELLKDFEQANLFRAKYEPIFMFNDDPADEELYNPYIPSDMFGFNHICNKDGNVMIAGEVKNFNNLTSVKETFYYQKEQEVGTKADIEESLNSLYIRHDKRKMWASSHRYMMNVYVLLRAHKKNVFGWNQYRTEYYFKYLGHDATTWTSSVFIRDLMNQPGQEGWTNELAHGTEFPIGSTRWVDTNNYTRGRVTFRMKSRGTADHTGVLVVNY